MSNIIEKLTENIVSRDLSKEGAALVNKWEKTGLLEGLGNDRAKDNMSRLLENQAKELLREASTMAAGDVEGFAAVAFPIVRRVFGGLLANDLVSVQPMSLPSGLIFFMDFTKNEGQRLGNTANDSVYGGNAVASQITGGVQLSGREQEKSFYSLNQGYSSPVSGGTIVAQTVVASGAIDANGEYQHKGNLTQTISAKTVREILRYDPDVCVSGTGIVIVKSDDLAGTAASLCNGLNKDNLISVTFRNTNGDQLTSASTDAEGLGLTQVRRLSTYQTGSTGADDRDKAFFVFTMTGTLNFGDEAGVLTTDSSEAFTDAKLGFAGTATLPQMRVLQISYATADGWEAAGAIGGVQGSAFSWLLEGRGDSVSSSMPLDVNTQIPEIDIKVDSIAVTAVTKKLRAKWSPELGQDLNAYHNLDAEVELTGILSEQVALEIDREIINDLIQRATGGTLHWARSPGLFVNRETGAEIGASSAAPDFTGTVSEWYETLLETVNDVSARIHRKTLRGGANFIVTSPEVASILEFTAGFRASVTVDSNGTAGANKTGSISKKYDVYVDPYFPRNLVLVGRKGSSFLESGYVYAPYVPLQVTPTIFGTEDFAPRKGVMTRYAKQMVRPDMYGLVVVHGLVGLAGATA